MAVEVTTKQMALLRDTGPGGFMERVQAMMGRVAGVVLNESGGTPYHNDRARYAQTVVQNPQGTTYQAGTQVVMGVNVIAGTTYDEETKTATNTMADIDLESQITSLWNSLAGINTSS